MALKKLTGGCLCGSVRYSISEKPQRGYICHCRFCQKQTGMGARPAISVDRASVEIRGGSVGQYKHVIPGHGRAIYPMFCNKCGTNLGSTLEKLLERREEARQYHAPPHPTPFPHPRRFYDHHSYPYHIV